MVPSEEIYLQTYKFYRGSNDGIWSSKLEIPIEITAPIETQLHHIIHTCKITEANIAFVRMYGYEKREDMIGLPLSSILPLDHPEELEHIRNFIRRDYNLLDEESLELDKFGNHMYFLNSVQGIVEDGKLVRIWGVQKDITSLKQSQIKMQKLLNIEKILSEISRIFITINKKNFEEMINLCLKKLGEFTGVDRVYLFDIHGSMVSNTFEWCKVGIEPCIDQNQNIPIEYGSKVMIEQLKEKNYYIGSENNNFQELSTREIEIMRAQSIQSLVLVGIRKVNDLVGFVGFDSVSELKDWKEEDIGLLRIFSDMLSIIMENISIQKELKAKEDSIAEFYERINEDLELAKVTQKNIISLKFPESDRFKLTSYFKPYEKVGGDVISYYDHEEFIDILFGDVSGHGISSAMVSGMVILSFKNSSRLKEKPNEVLRNMNRDLKEIVLNHHISAVSTRFCPKRWVLQYSYAGHPPLALIRNGKVVELDGMNTPLLTIDNIDYFAKEIQLESKDRVIFYSDGCFEVFNKANEFMGLYPFFDILEKNSKVTNSIEFIQKTIGQVIEYCSDDIRDDLTVLVLDIP
ncbi:MAG: SpoIIE family protein phosphatase [Leptospira sp.]|nr:SpoIIE family protein phosphatase [Leptospira sp.]